VDINSNKLCRLITVVGLLVVGGFAQAATVYCPNGPTGALVAPLAGRYVEVTNAQDPGTCYFQEGNLQNSDFPAVAAAAGVPAASLLLLDKNGAEGSMQGALVAGGFVGNSTSGTWSLSSNLWTSYSALYLGFHFGNGGGSPDSFVVQLQNNSLSGAWSFLAVAPDAVNGLSNYYLLGVADGSPPPGRIPEPASMALVGVALLAAGLARRRQKPTA
jgi:hypothetical protein